MKIKLTVDSRDFNHAQTFGQAIEIPEEADFDSILPDEVQPFGDVKCVAYSTCDQAEDEFKKEFDINDLWNRVPSTINGSNPRDVFNVVISQEDNGGLLPIGQTVRMKDYKTYYRADMGQRDAFDNVRVSATIAQKSVVAGLFWCEEWIDVPANGVMPIGITIMNGHAFTIEGWKIINGEPMFKIEAWLGRKLWMPRSVFNEAMTKWGAQTWILATAELNNKRSRTILEAIRDTLINVVLIMQRLLAKSPPVDKPIEVKPQEVYNEVKETMKRDLIKEFCEAIAQYEGGPGDLNHRNNNPGNIRNKSGVFLKFATWDEGFKALEDYVRRACTGLHKAYKPDFTITQFFEVYAPSSDKNNPYNYASWVAGKLGVLTTMKIKDLV